MNTYITLLRGINVGGHYPIKMADLKSLFEKLGFQNVSTYIQSGNIIFNSPSKIHEATAQQSIALAIEKQHGYKVPVTILHISLYKKIVNNNPYIKKGANEDSLYVTFFNASQKGLDLIDKKAFLPDDFMATPHAAYLHLNNPYHKTKLSNAFFEKATSIPATTRNWKTVCKLLELLT